MNNNIDSVQANKECMRILLPKLYEQGEDNLYFFIAALSSDENLENLEICEASTTCLRNVRELLDELNILESDKRKSIQDLIDKSINICVNRKKEFEAK